MENVLLIAMATLALTSAACATVATNIDRAVTVHNVYRRVLLDVDGVFVPSLIDADRKATERFKEDDELYAAEMKPWKDAVAALKAARLTEQALHLSIEQWQAGNEDKGILSGVYACAADSVDRLSLAFGTLPDNSVLYAASFAIGSQLRALADGATCEVK